MNLRYSALALLASGSMALQAPVLANTAIMDAVGVDTSQFAVVSAPISGSGRAQLQIYEQLPSQRACYSFSGNTVEPLLVNFDFTNVCKRYIDSNGYSLRIGRNDLGTAYSLSVRRVQSEHVLEAVPSRPEAGPRLVIARTTGDSGEKFLRFQLAEGWSLRRRSWQGVRLDHLYIYREDWPTGTQEIKTVSNDLPPREVQETTTTPVPTNPVTVPTNAVKKPAIPKPLF